MDEYELVATRMCLAVTLNSPLLDLQNAFTSESKARNSAVYTSRMTISLIHENRRENESRPFPQRSAHSFEAPAPSPQFLEQVYKDSNCSLVGQRTRPVAKHMGGEKKDTSTTEKAGNSLTGKGIPKFDRHAAESQLS